MLGGVVLALLHFALSWTQQEQRLAFLTPRPFALLATIIAITTAIYVVLTLLVSRRRNRVAAWILIAIFLFSIPTFVQTFTVGSRTRYTLLAEIQIIDHLAAYILLFLPSSRAWFRREDQKPDLNATFS